MCVCVCVCVCVCHTTRGMSSTACGWSRVAARTWAREAAWDWEQRGETARRLQLRENSRLGPQSHNPTIPQLPTHVHYGAHRVDASVPQQQPARGCPRGVDAVQ